MKSPAPASPRRIRLFLAEATLVNCELMERALRHELRGTQFSVTACAVASSEVLKLLKKQMPNVALISANLPDGPLTGFHVLLSLRVMWPKTRIVMLVDQPTQELVVDTFRYGAHGLFRRNASFKALCRCVRAVAAGQIWVNSEELGHLLEAFTAATPLRIVNANGAPILSPREEAIVGLITQSLTNRQIATALELSEHTVRNYIYHIYNKLGVSNRVELAVNRVSTPHAAQTLDALSVERVS
jgi:DNA-binding NarL/FixJ family response regulator